MRRIAAATTLASEAVANVATGGILALLVVVATGGMVFGVTATTIGEVARADRLAADLEERGRGIVRMDPADPSSPVDAAACEAVAATQGTEATGAVLRTDRRAKLLSGATVTLQTVTVGLVRVLGGRTPPAGAIAIGALVAEEAGLRTGAVLRFRAADEGVWRSASVEVIPHLPRASAFEDSILSIAPAAGRIETCWAKVAPAHLAATSAAATAYAAPAAIVVNDFAPELAEHDPDAQRREAVAGSGVAVAAAALSVLGLLGWVTRRQDWMLYRVNGLGWAGRLGLASIEWALVSVVPTVAGAAWAVAAAPSSATRTCLLLGVRQGVAVALLAFVAVPVGAAITAATSPTSVLKGG